MCHKRRLEKKTDDIKKGLETYVLNLNPKEISWPFRTDWGIVRCWRENRTAPWLVPPSFSQENSYPTRKDGSKMLISVNCKHVLRVYYLGVLLSTERRGGVPEISKEFTIRGR